jgi:hypothetical protein
MDIDIDISHKTTVEKIFPSIIPASMVEDGKIKKHLVGYYFQNIPVDSETGLSSIPYKDAEDFGFMKIDFLHLKLLDSFQSKEQIEQILKEPTDWNLLNDPEIVKDLFHLSKHYDLLQKIKPKSTEDLADALALIRPNKIKLLDKYLNNKEKIRKVLYEKNDPSDLRKSHAIAYALNIRLQLKILEKNYAVS